MSSASRRETKDQNEHWKGQMRLNLYKWSSFDEIGRNSSESGNIATALGIESPGSSASKW